MNTTPIQSQSCELRELELSIKQQSEICCPKCSNDTIVKKSSVIDIPKAAIFFLFLGASFAVVLIINLVLLLRIKLKKQKLHRELQAKLNEDDSSSFMGLNVPSMTSISCSKCGYIFYRNYDEGDFIVVLAMFLIIIFLVALFVIFLVYKRN